MLKTPQGQSLYCLLESSHFILCVCLDETPLEPIWTFELWGSGHFECFLFGTAVWLAETVIKIFGCQSKRNGLALWWAIIRKRSWRDRKKTLNARVSWKNNFAIPLFGSLYRLFVCLFVCFKGRMEPLPDKSNLYVAVNPNKMDWHCG